MDSKTRTLLSEVAVYLNEYVDRVDERFRGTKCYLDLDKMLNALGRTLLNPVTLDGCLYPEFSFTTVGVLPPPLPSASNSKRVKFAADSVKFVAPNVESSDDDFVAAAAPAKAAPAKAVPAKAPSKKAKVKKPSKCFTDDENETECETDADAYADAYADAKPQGSRYGFPDEIVFTRDPRGAKSFPYLMDVSDLEGVLSGLRSFYECTKHRKRDQSSVRSCLKLLKHLNVSWGSRSGGTSELSKSKDLYESKLERLRDWYTRQLKNHPGLHSELVFMNDFLDGLGLAIEEDYDTYLESVSVLSSKRSSDCRSSDSLSLAKSPHKSKRKGSFDEEDVVAKKKKLTYLVPPQSQPDVPPPILFYPKESGTSGDADAADSLADVPSVPTVTSVPTVSLIPSLPASVPSVPSSPASPEGDMVLSDFE